jgi:fibrillarin-like rRNA methylase
MVTIDKEKQEYMRKKLRIAFLGESSLMTQNRVAELCQKFFEYGIEYANKNNK